MATTNQIAMDTPQCAAEGMYRGVTTLDLRWLLGWLAAVTAPCARAALRSDSSQEPLHCLCTLGLVHRLALFVVCAGIHRTACLAS